MNDQHKADDNEQGGHGDDDHPITTPPRLPRGGQGGHRPESGADLTERQDAGGPDADSEPRHPALPGLDELATAWGIPDGEPQLLTQHQVTATSHSGPLPEAEMLRAYESIYPGAAKMIFDDFDRQSRLQEKVVESATIVDAATADATRLIADARARGIKLGAWLPFAVVGLMGVGMVGPAFGLPDTTSLLSVGGGLLLGAAATVQALANPGQKPSKKTDSNDDDPS